MEPAFPSPTNHLKCRLSILFSFPVNSIQLCNYVWTSKNPVCSLALLFLKSCVLEKIMYSVFLLPIGERFYLLRHCFWRTGHATLLASVCCFVSVLSDVKFDWALWKKKRYGIWRSRRCWKFRTGNRKHGLKRKYRFGAKQKIDFIFNQMTLIFNLASFTQHNKIRSFGIMSTKSNLSAAGREISTR